MKNATPEEARKLFAQKCDLAAVAAEPTQFPRHALPEVAFIGRSNVGKSSLINALVGRKGLARASKTPGRTQQIVFFNLADKLMLADLPGYGHASAPLEQKARWMGLVDVYLRKRENLKCVCLLLDARHEAKATDIDMMDFLDRNAVVFQIVLTKIDARRKAEHAKSIEEATALAADHAAALSEVIATSAEDKVGIDKLREFVAGFLNA